MAKHATITVLKTNPYEIAKAEDMNEGFQLLTENIALLLDAAVQADRDFIIGGTIVPATGLSVAVKPFIAFCKATGAVYINRTDTIVELEQSSATQNRIDVLTIACAEWYPFQQEKRATWYVTDNPPSSSGISNDSMIFKDIDKRQKQNIIFEVIKGSNNDETAPLVTTGGIKLAEIHIKAARNGLDAADIHNITARIDGQPNKNWSQEKTRTFFIASIKDFLSIYFKIHKPDGTLQNGVVEKKHLALSSGDMLTACDIALGEKIEKKADRFNPVTGENQYITPIESSAKLEINLLATSKIKKTLDTVFNALIYIWKTFIQADRAVLRLGNEHTNIKVIDLSEKFDKKLAAEKKERQEADSAEESFRKQADETEKQQRKEADKTEQKERIEADKTEQKERIEADKQNRELAEKAISLSLPVGSATLMYDNGTHETFLPLDGSVFEPSKHPEFYAYWQKNLAYWGKDTNGKPFLPQVETADESRLGEIATFIGDGYHHEFLICNGLPFSPDVYKEFYEHCWKPYLSHLGKDLVTGWPYRPKLKSSIEGTSIYIKALAHESQPFTQPFIKTGKTQ